MRILAIETSCDDTGIAILEVKGVKTPSFKVLSNIVSSQIKIHRKYGGVFPMMAKREHQANLVPVLAQALKQAQLVNPKSKILNPKKNINLKLKTIGKILEKESNLYENLKDFLEKYEKPDVDLIAITNGPGLEPCLWVGVNFAKALSYFWDIPVIPVNHIEAHILINFIKHETWKMEQMFPAISLIVSGGHTQLILVNGIGKYKIIGETRDDAAGECFDKTAKILGLSYPGGPEIARIAKNYKLDAKSHKLNLPRPMINSKDYDFSFSGLKTAVLYIIRDRKDKFQSSQELWNKNNVIKDDPFVKDMCVEIQQAIIDVLIKKTIRAAKDYKAKTIVLGGGVSANQELRKQLKEKIHKDMLNTKYLIPDSTLSTDNALMIAITGYFHKNKKASWKNLKANANLRISR